MAQGHVYTKHLGQLERANIVRARQQSEKAVVVLEMEAVPLLEVLLASHVLDQQLLLDLRHKLHFVFAHRRNLLVLEGLVVTPYAHIASVHDIVNLVCHLQAVYVAEQRALRRIQREEQSSCQHLIVVGLVGGLDVEELAAVHHQRCVQPMRLFGKECFGVRQKLVLALELLQQAVQGEARVGRKRALSVLDSAEDGLRGAEDAEPRREMIFVWEA